MVTGECHQVSREEECVRARLRMLIPRIDVPLDQILHLVKITAGGGDCILHDSHDGVYCAELVCENRTKPDALVLWAILDDTGVEVIDFHTEPIE